MSSKRKCIVILLFIVLVTILFILYKRSQFFFGISYRCKYSVYEVHSKSFKNHTKLPVNRSHRKRAQLHINLLKNATTTELPPLPEHSLTEQKLFLKNIGLNKPQRITKFKDCPEGRVLTTLFGGEWGNIVWEYMSLIAVEELYSDRLNMQAFMPGNMKEWLERAFININTPEIKELPISCISMRNAQIVRYNEKPVYESRVPYNSPVILDIFASRYEDVIHFGLENIKSYLQFDNKYIKISTNVLISLKKQFKFNTTDDVTFVGIHYRGGTYNKFLNRTYGKKFKGPPSYRYYKNAMSFFNQTITNVIFIFISKEHHWIRKNIPHLHGYNIAVNPVKNVSTIDDFTLLSFCNHSIINYGTYGAAAALFAGGTTFVYDINIPTDGRGPTLAIGIASVLPNWFLCDEMECKLIIQD